MIRAVILCLAIATVYCQYPQQRAPALRYRPEPEDYDDQYAPEPRQAAPPPRPQPAFRSNNRPIPTHRPAPVHYVNIGLELAGDYKFGYDTGKGDDGQSFREETRLPDGSVQGQYGYIDETGKQRIVKYTAGKEGFKVIKDTEPAGAPRSSPRAAPAPAPQPAPMPQPQPAPRPQPQPAYRPPAPQPQPAYRPAPQPQPSYRAPAPQPEPVYRAPAPQPQPSYRAPAPQPQPRSVYRAPAPEPAYAPEPEYRRRARPQQASRRRPAPKPVETYNEEPDYDYPNNEITERRLVPIDTSLFNYNIGTSQQN